MSRGVLQVVVAVAFAGTAALAAWRLRLGLARPIALAALRALAQLAVVGAAIALVFRVPALAVVFVAVMLCAAALTSAGRLRGIPGAPWRTAVSIGAPAGVAVGLLLATGAFATTPRAAVPAAGILIGGAMTATTLAGRRLLEALADDVAEIEARLSLGDDARTALAPAVRRSVTTALVPVIDQTRTVGLVTLPGTFVGLVLGGASPAQAARIQALVLLALLAVELAGALLITELICRTAIAPGERVRDAAEMQRATPAPPAPR